MINLDADNENDENDEEEEEGNWVDYEGGEREDMWVERMRLGMGDRAIISSSKHSLSLPSSVKYSHIEDREDVPQNRKDKQNTKGKREAGS